MEASLSSYFTFALLTQCLFGIIYLSTYQWQRNRWIVLGLACIFFLQLGVLIGGDTISFYKKMMMGNPGLMLIVMPSFYLFTKEVVSVKTNHSNIFLHFLPGLTFYVAFLFAEVNHPLHFMALLAKGEAPLLHLAHLISIFVITIYYGYRILKLIKYNQKKYKNEYADTSIFLTLNWLRYLIWATLILTFLALCSIPFVYVLADISLPFAAIQASFLMSIMLTCYFAFRQPTLYQSSELVSDLENIDEATPVHAKSLLSAAQIELIAKKTNTYLAEHQPYLNPKVKMPDIASYLQISSNELSWYLNEHLNINFFTFINQYRIEYAIDLLKSPEYEHYTLEAISKMAGFRSKTTFNNRFKEIMGLTPSAFRKQS